MEEIYSPNQSMTVQTTVRSCFYKDFGARLYSGFNEGEQTSQDHSFIYLQKQLLDASGNRAQSWR